MRKGKPMPVGFPNAILPVVGTDGSVKLNEGYRMYDSTAETYNEEAEEQFVWFVENILSKINPRATDYTARCKREVISEIFHPTDEAWALMIMLNEIEAWEWDARKKESTDPSSYALAHMKPKTRFTSRENTNSKKKWSDGDLAMLRRVRLMVSKRRENELCMKWEKEFMRRKQPQSTARTTTTINAAGGESSLASAEGEVDAAMSLECVEANKMASDDFDLCFVQTQELVQCDFTNQTSV